MDAVEIVLDTIKGIIAAFKSFFEDIIAMFQSEENSGDATV